MQELLSMEAGDKLLPFIRQFYNSPSTLLWEDELSITDHIQQGEGGEQGHPLMPLLFALVAHSVLVAVPEMWQDGEFLFAFLDDLSPHQVTSGPHSGLLHIMRQELWNHRRFLVTCMALKEAARLDDVGAVVWKGDADLPPSQQGIKILCS